MTQPPSRAVVLAHGGAGGPRDHDDACEAACARGIEALGEGASALEAAIRATMVLEDDPRLNAGTGSNFRLDGATIEMDAAVMDHAGNFGGVAAIQRVRYPVRVAELVMESPHLLLCGDGATLFARMRGVPDHDPSSERARRRYRQVQEFFTGRRDSGDFAAWRGIDPRRFWNLPGEVKESLLALAGPSDTVGAVARDASGRPAAALSTGGTSIMMLGRVGDTPIIGAGIFAGPRGAVVATGDGEEIMRRVLAKQVYDRLAAGVSAQAAVEEGTALVPPEYAVGLLAVSPHDEGIADNRTMPRAVRHLDPFP